MQGVGQVAISPAKDWGKRNISQKPIQSRKVAQFIDVQSSAPYDIRRSTGRTQLARNRDSTNQCCMYNRSVLGELRVMRRIPTSNSSLNIFALSPSFLGRGAEIVSFAVPIIKPNTKPVADRATSNSVLMSSILIGPKRPRRKNPHPPTFSFGISPISSSTEMEPSGKFPD